MTLRVMSALILHAMKQLILPQISQLARAGKKSRFADNIGAKPTAPHASWGARNKRFNATRHFQANL